MLLQADSGNAVETVTALIIAVTGVIGAVASLFLGIGNKLKSNSHDDRLIRLGDNMVSVGQLGTAFSQKTKEHADDLKTVASVLTTLSPDVKKKLEEQGKGIEYWTERANIASQQLNRLLPMVPREAQANAVDNIPREGQKTLQATN